MNFNLTSLLEILKRMPKVDLSKYHAALGLVVPLLPEKIKLKGKIINLRATIAAAVADDDIDNDDILAFVVAWVSAEVDPKLPTPSLPPAITPKPYTPAPEVPPAIVTPSSVWPTSLVLEVHSMAHLDEDIPFTVDEDHDEYSQIRRTDGVDSITGHTRLLLGVSYRDAKGNPINFERDNALHLYYTAQWEGISENGRGSDTMVSHTPGATPPDGQVERTSNGVVNWRAFEGERTGMMDPEVRIPEPPSSATRPQFVRFNARVVTPTGLALCKPLRTPPIR